MKDLIQRRPEPDPRWTGLAGSPEPSDNGFGFFVPKYITVYNRGG